MRDGSVKIAVPERGKKSKLLDLALQNAKQKIRQQEAKWESAKRNIDDALAHLRDVLKLTELPRRIEGYDISHTGGTETVGSMVVMINGKPNSKHYRSFTLRTVKGGEIDDYKSLKEVLRRRLRYLGASVLQQEKIWNEKGYTFGKARKKDQLFLQEIFELAEDAYKTFLIARKDDDIAGFARLYEHDGLIELSHVWVSDDDQLRPFLVQKLLKPLTKGKIYSVVPSRFLDTYTQLGFQEIRSPPASLDVSDMHTVLIYEASKNKTDTSLNDRPDLLVIDGGKGQLSTVVDVLAKLELSIPVIGLAKREEEVFAAGDTVPVVFAKDSQAKFLLMRLRNEAHRFANTLREKQLSKRTIGSILDEISGIGPKTKVELLQTFGSVQGIRDASDAQLKKVLSESQLKSLRGVLV